MQSTVSGRRRALRVRQVAEKTGLGVATVWRLTAEGNFPRPMKLSPGCTAWLEEELDAWIDAKAAARKLDNSQVKHPAP